MHRIDTPTAVPARPQPTPAGTPGYFTSGSPGAGQPATHLSADWCNEVQEELLTVVAAGGVTAQKGQTGQLWAALQAMGLRAAGAAQPETPTYAVPGSATLPGGLILKWGTSDLNVLDNANNHQVAVVFGTPFPHAPLWVGVTENDGRGLNNLWTRAWTAAGFTIVGRDTPETGTSPIAWLALGW